jgi:hypothetical protein
MEAVGGGGKAMIYDHFFSQIWANKIGRRGEVLMQRGRRRIELPWHH